MPKAIKPWNKSDLKNIPVGVHFVGGVGGLTLQVKARRRSDLRPPASWVLRVNIGSRRRNMGLGAYPEVTLNEARQRALEIKTLCLKGIDPIDQKRRQRLQCEVPRAEQTTFKQVAEGYLSAHQVNYRNAKHSVQWRSSLETYAYPLLATLPIKDVTPEHVLETLGPIWMIKTETAKRVQGRLERIFDFAIASGLRETNPARWRNYLALRLPAPGKIAKVRHFPSLPYQGMPQFMSALNRRKGTTARALEYLILTAARSGSVRQARWPEIDFEALEWRIPKDHTKTRSGDHRVPLTPQMVSLLKALPRRLDTDLIFPSQTGKMLSDMALNVLMRKMRASGDLWVDAVPHGFRSTFRVWAAEATNYPSELAELVLMHSVGSAVYQAYQRSDLFEKRRQIMTDWNETVFKRCEKVVAFA